MGGQAVSCITKDRGQEHTATLFFNVIYFLDFFCVLTLKRQRSRINCLIPE
jgi:hypothetical protein